MQCNTNAFQFILTQTNSAPFGRGDPFIEENNVLPTNANAKTNAHAKQMHMQKNANTNTNANINAKNGFRWNFKALPNFCQ